MFHQRLQVAERAVGVGVRRVSQEAVVSRGLEQAHVALLELAVLADADAKARAHAALLQLGGKEAFEEEEEALLRRVVRLLVHGGRHILPRRTELCAPRRRGLADVREERGLDRKKRLQEARRLVLALVDEELSHLVDKL